ncbi:hypothetical protein VNO80_28497 [Phaseolus coccineus]|uniref:Uncharacterized protein n=1 Tax=Phaseolus coccineus TaxID=3886 RepID=A0AAN9QHL4_PHACN
MARKKIPIKKIDNINARQVTFSKRRKGLFKKAQELSTLCDAEIALIVISATSKLFEYATSSMQQIFERRNRHSGVQASDISSTGQQLGSDSFDMLRKEIVDKTHELSRLNGEELQGLTIQELQKLEELLLRRWITISKIKDEKITQEINSLITKEAELTEENQKLKQKLVPEQRQCYESITSSSSDFPPDNGSSDTSLKLGKNCTKKAAPKLGYCYASVQMSPSASCFRLQNKITERHILRSEFNQDKLDQLYPTEQIRNNHAYLKKELEDRSREMRQLNGEELQGLSLKELQKLEGRLDLSLNCVYKAKVQNITREITILTQKRINSRNEICSVERHEHEQDQSFDTSLTLGLPLPSGSN